MESARSTSAILGYHASQPALQNLNRNRKRYKAEFEEQLTNQMLLSDQYALILAQLSFLRLVFVFCFAVVLVVASPASA
ncbi:hypothetical protein QG37_00550 [Candidozyma auris]|nr:hypothetical protein QG37_00550 [[Candida] auris]